MARVEIHNVGSLGIHNDIPGYELPPEAWTDGRNVRMYDNAVWKAFGYEATLGNPSVVPYGLIPTVTASGGQIFAYPGLAAVYGTDGTTHADITRSVGGVYGGAASDLWNGGAFGGVVVLNNGVDVPQVWISPDLATRLVDLANWPANTLAKVIRPFKRYLVAYDVTVSSVRSAQLVKWSDRTDIGAVPGSWDPTDPTNRAGEWPLLETDGAILDALSLGDVNFVYKEDAIHTMEEVGGNFVFRFRRKFGQVGLLAQRCVKEYLLNDRRFHVLATPEDIVRHDGLQMNSLLDTKMRRWYNGRIDLSQRQFSFVTPNYTEDEIWVGIAEAGETYANLALIINMKDGSCAIQELPNVFHIAWAAIDPNAGAITFDSQTIPFDQMVGRFGQRNYAPGRKRLIMVDPASTGQFLLADQGFSFSGSNFRAYVERLGLSVVGNDRFGNLKSDPSVVKLVTEVWPRARLSPGQTLDVYVGAQDYHDGPITWSGPFAFDPSVDMKVDVDPPVEGRFIATRFENPVTSSTYWKLDGYDLEVHNIGAF